MRLVALVVGALAVLGSACTPPFEIPSDTTITVPGAGILDPNPLLPEQVFPADLIADALVDSINQSFDTQAYDKGSVKSLTLTTLSLTVTNAEQAGGRELKDLSFFESLVVFIAPSGGDPIKVAESDETAFAEQQLTYDMPLTGAELADALKSSDALDMTAEIDAGEQPQFATDIRIDSVLTVVLGL